jgi:hypothetical protein
MDLSQTDPNRDTVLDGNAAAGILSEIFTVEMTNSATECGNCGREGEMATLMAFLQAPGAVLRCPVCNHVILRIVQSPSTTYLDIRGAAYISFRR